MTDDDFILGIEQDPADLNRRLVYADWLEEHGDPRGEFLRAQVRLIERPTTNVEHAVLLACLQDLERTFDPCWAARVRPVLIENCSAQLEWCPRYWPRLTITSDKSIRFCERCREKVFFCSNIDLARTHVAVNERIAVSSVVTRKPGDLDSVVWDIEPAFYPDEDDEDFEDELVT